MAEIKGGQQLDDALRDLAGRVAVPATLAVGFLENAKYVDGKSVAMIAAINEYGAPSRGQPPRPFFRRMITAKQGEWGPAIAALLEANNLDARRALDLAGAGIAGQLRQSIVDLVAPPLAPSTIRRKGFDKPLIHTGHMLNSVDHEVRT
jgi:hypothetical protein